MIQLNKKPKFMYSSIFLLAEFIIFPTKVVTITSSDGTILTPYTGIPYFDFGTKM